MKETSMLNENKSGKASGLDGFPEKYPKKGGTTESEWLKFALPSLYLKN